VLYTHQKLKKAKTWQDGVLKVTDDGSRASLYAGNDSGAALESIHLRAPVSGLKSLTVFSNM
jgi:hypothetical protein